MMQRVKKRKKKVGSIVYGVFLTLWILLLAGVVYQGWKTAMRFGEYWEAAQISPKVDEYVDRLSVEMWENGENGITNTIAAMEHPFQTNEECVEVLREILQEELRCLPGTGNAEENSKVYDLLCGRSKFGRVFLTQEVFTPEENVVLNWLIEKFALYPWRVDGVEFYLDGLYTTFDITVPQSFTVLLNGHPLTQEHIVESDIPYDVLRDYYTQFDGLPTKVSYHADRIFGHVEVQLLDADGNPAEIDPERDDSQFIEPVSDELVARFGDFAVSFSDRYLEFCTGVGDMTYLYGKVAPYVQKNSDLDDRMHRMIESYAGWQHNMSYDFQGATLNDVTHLGNDNYVLDISADAGSLMPSGYAQVHRDMKVYVRYFPDTGETFAFMAEDYNAEEN